MYKSFYIEEVKTGHIESSIYILYGKKKGWFKSYHNINSFTDLKLAEEYIQKKINYPKILSRRWYNADGIEDLMW